MVLQKDFKSESDGIKQCSAKTVLEATLKMDEAERRTHFERLVIPCRHVLYREEVSLTKAVAGGVEERNLQGNFQR